jgi:aquaporin TIP
MLAEFIATFALIFAGVGAIAVSTPLGGLQSLVGVALAHGLVLASMVTATAAISGGHVNPAVTLGALIAGQIKVWQAIGHVIAQVLGGIVGALLIGVCLPAGLLSRAGFGVPTPSAVTGAWTAVLIEFVLTFFLVFVVFGSAIDHRAPRVGGLFIGLTLVFGILVGGPLTGAALNPARFLGPSIAYATQLQDTWIYLLGPLAGGALAGLVWRFGFQVGQQAEA